MNDDSKGKESSLTSKRIAHVIGSREIQNSLLDKEDNVNSKDNAKANILHVVVT